MTGLSGGHPLIIDLGMNNGDDTAYYLAKGYNVVAVEANPSLAAAGQRRFAPQIAAGRLVILAQAISDQPGHVTFFVNEDNDHWSSLDIGWAGRDDSSCRPVQVETITLKDLFARYGVPAYLKIDVEGVDHIVLNQLSHEAVVPTYVSVEDCRFGFDYIETLAEIGYSGFKLLDQSSVPELIDDATGRPFARGSSGPFGEAVPGAWLSKPMMIETYSHTVRDRNGQRLAPRTQWWDLHAAKL